MRRATTFQIVALLLCAVAIVVHWDANGGDAVVPSSIPRSAPSCPPCTMRVVFSENFDNVIPPMLPLGWIATNAQGPPPLWVTSNSGVPPPPYDSFPNAAFIDDPAVVSDKRLDSVALYFPFWSLRPPLHSGTATTLKRQIAILTSASTAACWKSALMVEIHIKTSSPLAERFSRVATTAPSAPIGVVPLVVARLGAATRGIYQYLLHPPFYCFRPQSALANG